jgi:DNA-binding transcriptional ArsR family regulator
MAQKNNFLLVDLSEKKTKKLAETITSDTSRKILNFLVEKEDSEANIAKELQIPISTVHYHLQKLQEAGLVMVEEFHYSKKGREINHYKLANKYIIIAPKKVSGLKEKLRGILPVAIISIGIAAVIKLFTSFIGGVGSFQSSKMVATEAVTEAAPVLMKDVVEDMGPHPPMQACVQQPDFALWFLVGSISAIIIFLIVMMIREWRKRK